MEPFEAYEAHHGLYGFSRSHFSLASNLKLFMPLITHPFASTEYARFSRSAETLVRMARQERPQSSKEDLAPVPPLPPAVVAPKPVVPSLPPALEIAPTALPAINVDVPVWSSRGSPRHYVKHSSKITLLLSGQEQGNKIPEYTNGSVIDGIVAVPRPSALLSLDIMIEGTMKLKEIAGSGTTQTEIIKDSVFTWNAERNAPFPTKVTFTYPLPLYYTHKASGERCRLPPSYTAHLNGMPGFRVDVSYAIIIHTSRNRDKSDWWRRNACLRIPFVYTEQSCPSLAGPFPPNPIKSSACPKTLFSFTLKSRQDRSRDIAVKVFLPASQICPLSSPMPFCVTFTGDEDSLAPFSSYRPSSGSFHPLSPPNSSAGSLPQQIMPFVLQSHPPLEVSLLRHTDVDVIEATEVGEQAPTHITGSKRIVKGTFQDWSREVGSLSWSGVIVMPPHVRCGGFNTKGIKVKDSVVLRICSPDPARAAFMDFNEAIPIRLTTLPHSNIVGLAVSSESLL